MNQRPSIEELSAFMRALNLEFPKMNCGGCCVFAALLQPRLNKHYPTCIKVSDWYRHSDNLINLDKLHSYDNIRDWELHHVNFSHVYCQFTDGVNTLSIDTRGIRTQLDRNTYPGTLPIELAQQFAKEENIWNRAFNRADIPKIEDQIEKFFFNY